MKIHSPPTSAERGTAILVVLAVLLLILAFMAGNNATLRCLHRELQLIEQRQLRRCKLPDAASGPIARAPALTSDPAPAASTPARPLPASPPR